MKYTKVRNPDNQNDITISTDTELVQTKSGSIRFYQKVSDEFGNPYWVLSEYYSNSPQEEKQTGLIKFLLSLLE